MTRFAMMILLLAAAPALAGEVTLTITSGGMPLAGAVVTVRAATAPPGPIRFAPSYEIVQRDIAFEPHVLILPANNDVAFTNMDRVRHHVFSFASAKRFELKLFGQEEARKVRFTTPGVIPIGCNIHDRMSAYIVVVDTPYALQSDAHGLARWHDVAAGPATVTVWHPRLRAPGNSVTLPLAVSGNGAVARTVAIELRPEAAASPHL